MRRTSFRKGEVTLVPSVSFTLSSKGMAEIKRGLTADAVGVRKAVSAGLYEMATDIADDSEQLVPFKEGILQSSRLVVDNKGSDRYLVEVSYGGNAMDYALVQHENLSFKHTNGRSAKYLETPFRSRTKNFAQTLTAYVRKHYQLGTGR